MQNCRRAMYMAVVYCFCCCSGVMTRPSVIQCLVSLDDNNRNSYYEAWGDYGVPNKDTPPLSISLRDLAYVHACSAHVYVPARHWCSCAHRFGSRWRKAPAELPRSGFVSVVASYLSSHPKPQRSGGLKSSPTHMCMCMYMYSKHMQRVLHPTTGL